MTSSVDRSSGSAPKLLRTGASTLEVLAPADTSTLVRGATVALSTTSGLVFPGALLGIFHRDERLISKLRVTVDGLEPPLLAANRTGASTERIASLASLDEFRNGQALLVRHRSVSPSSVKEDVELRSFHSTRTVEVNIELACDGTSILALKSGHVPAGSLAWTVEAQGRRATSWRGPAAFALVTVDESATLHVSPHDATSLSISWKPTVEVGQVWTGEWSVTAFSVVEHVEVRPLFRFSSFRTSGDDYRWEKATTSAAADLEALVIDLPERRLRFIGAGAPWYQALFGRDSIIAAWESLPLGTDLALDVLETLAAFAGTATLERTRQAPGKIPHEWRVGAPQVFGLSPGEVYYGTVDASPLFVMLLAEVYRWGAAIDRVRALLPAARAALRWARSDATMVHGVDHGPLIWYTPDPKGLGNQGWKDSGDCMLYADGTLAVGSIAIAEVQSYAYEALRSMARLERDLGGSVPGPSAFDPEALDADAERLQTSFLHHFWSPSDGLLAMAIAEDFRPLQVASSNMGQCLWSGILPAPVARAVAERVMQPDLLASSGIRTLGSRERGYNPMGYHLGTVWAHDSALIAAGLARHGYRAPFRELCSRLLDAAERFGWRLPELYAGLDAGVDGVPLPYPAACSPQAWSAGAPLLLLRSALGFEPDVPAGHVVVRPNLGPEETLRFEGLVLGTRSLSLEVRGENVVACSGLDGLTIGA